MTHAGGSSLIRKRLAYLDQYTSNNTVVFTFENAVSNEDVFPGKNAATNNNYCLNYTVIISLSAIYISMR